MAFYYVIIFSTKKIKVNQKNLSKGREAIIMKAKVVYYTKSGNTEKLAKAIGEELNADVANMDNNLREAVDVLFLGASVYKFGIDKQVLAFIENLNTKEIGTVVLFSTSAMSDSGYPKLKKSLEGKGIKVHEKHFYCRGEFMFANKNRPNADDITDVKAFAKSIVK